MTLLLIAFLAAVAVTFVWFVAPTVKALTGPQFVPASDDDAAWLRVQYKAVTVSAGRGV